MFSTVPGHTPTLIKENKETANSPIETRTAIMTFNPNFIDFTEKTGIKRKRPRTKAVYTPMKNIINQAFVNMDMKEACGLRAVVTVETTPAIGTAINQPFSNIALTNLPSPEGVFRKIKRVSFPRAVTSPVIITTMTGNRNCPIIYINSGPIGSDLGTTI